MNDLLSSLVSTSRDSVMQEPVDVLLTLVDHARLNDVLARYEEISTWMCLDDVLGFMYDYLHLSRYLTNHGSWVHDTSHKPIPRITQIPYRVIDVGCASGIQQAFFPNYVGVDYGIIDGMPTLHDGASFMKGRFADLIESGELVINRETDFGIANMSLLYGGHDENLFKSVFKRCVII